MSSEQVMQDLFNRFSSAQDITDNYLKELYERDGFDSMELSILFHTLSMRYLREILSEHVGVNEEHMKELDKVILDEYNNKESKDPLLDQVIKYNRLAGISLATLQVIIQDMK